MAINHHINENAYYIATGTEMNELSFEHTY